MKLPEGFENWPLKDQEKYLADQLEKYNKIVDFYFIQFGIVRGKMGY